MPKSILTDSELNDLLIGVVSIGQAGLVETTLRDCHEYESTSRLMPWEKYRMKRLTYRGFDLSIPNFETEAGSVSAADIQFRRPAKFPAPFVNRNRSVIRRIRRLLDSHYAERPIQVVPGSEGKQIHYDNSNAQLRLVDFEDSGSECALYDEPHSSGQTPEYATDTRNDFIILRFRRKEA